MEHQESTEVPSFYDADPFSLKRSTADTSPLTAMNSVTASIRPLLSPALGVLAFACMAVILAAPDTQYDDEIPIGSAKVAFTATDSGGNGKVDIDLEFLATAPVRAEIVCPLSVCEAGPPCAPLITLAEFDASLVHARGPPSTSL